MKVFVFLSLVATLASSASAQGTCPDVPQCSGCLGSSTRRVVCSNQGLTDFPLLPLDVQQSVSTLTLQSNNISILERSDLQNYTSLETLDISSSNLMLIEEGSLDNATALEELRLNDNQLTELPDSLFEFSLIQTLDLSQNNIGSVSAATFTGIQAFSTINLEGNVIRSIPNGTFSGLGRLEEINLGDNPLRCDCELRWFPAYLTDSPPLLDIAATCDVPMSLRGQNIRSLTIDDFLCECSPMCVNGTCDMTVGECVCDDGYIGDDCSVECPVGTYGAGCQSNCTCVAEHESTPCDYINGMCHCSPGYTGPSCELECPEGFYGQDCLEVCQCQNGADCDIVSGFCNCTIGYMGTFCDTICPPLLYGLGCSLSCNCTTGNCHHITGECACPIGYYGNICDHNCTEVPDCASIGREECSLATPQQTCGDCRLGYVGEDGTGNTECILCSGAPDCEALNREPCGEVVNTCGPCFTRHLGEEGYSNQPCFDPCIDGVMNYDETDVDCGGSLCPSCQLGEACTSSIDCGDTNRSVCLGVFKHESGLEYPIDSRDNNTCVDRTSVDTTILDIFREFLGNLEALSNVSPSFDRDELEQEVGAEMRTQFGIMEPLQSVLITQLSQEPGNFLFQTFVELQSSTSDTQEIFSKMIENMHNGKLKGTLLLNDNDKKALFNF